MRNRVAEHNQGWVYYTRVTRGTVTDDSDIDNPKEQKYETRRGGLCRVEKIPRSYVDSDGWTIKVTTRPATDEEVEKKLAEEVAYRRGQEAQRRFESRSDYADAAAVKSTFEGNFLEDIIDRLTPAEWAELRTKLASEG